MSTYPTFEPPKTERKKLEKVKSDDKFVNAEVPPLPQNRFP